MMEELENPFLEIDETLLCLDTKDIAENIVCDAVNKKELVRKQKPQEFFNEILVKKTKSIDDTLHKNRLPISSHKPSLQSKHSCDISTLKENVKFFSQLCVANQTRNCDMSNFFSHKNTYIPPSLSKYGKVRSGNKADLLNSLYDGCNTQDTKSTTDGIVVEGTVLVYKYRSTAQKTFKEYSEERLETLLQEKLIHVNRVDVVWNAYLENSLKMTTRQKRGNGSGKN